jgi:hypothetical protein
MRNKLIKILLKEIKITNEVVLNSASEIDASSELKEAVRKIILLIKNKKIKEVEYINKEPTEVVINYVVDIFPLSLWSLSAVDFDGYEPITIEELIKTGIDYFLIELKEGSVPNLKLK